MGKGHPVARNARLRRLGASALRFGLGQASSQLLSLGTAILILHHLALGNYATYTLTASFQTTFSLLIDLGYTQSIIALSSRLGVSPQAMGELVAGAVLLRVRLTLAGAIVSPVVFITLAERIDHSLDDRLLLASLVVLTVAFQRNNVYASPFLITGNVGRYYLILSFVGALRFSLVLILLYSNGLTAITGVAASAAASLIQGLLLKDGCRRLGLIQRPSDPTVVRERARDIQRYVRPLLPIAIYNALHSQSIIALASVFGSSAEVAQLGALGRLGQLFSFPTQFNVVVLEPLIASAPNRIIKKLARLSYVISLLVTGLVTLSSYLFPRLIIYILGSRYMGLVPLLPLALAIEGVALSGSSLGVFARARGFAYWWQTGANISVSIGVQVVLALSLPLTHISSILILSLSSLVIDVIFYILAIEFGISRGPRAFGSVSR